MDKAIIKEQLQVVLEETAHKIQVIEDRGRMTPFIRSTKQGLQLRYEALKRLANSVTWDLPAHRQEHRQQQPSRFYDAPEQAVGAFERGSRHSVAIRR